MSYIKKRNTMRKAGLLSGLVVFTIGISSCSTESDMRESGMNEQVTPDETRILNDSSKPETFGENETREQVVQGFLNIPWSQPSGDIRQTAKSGLQQNGITISKEESKGNATKYTLNGGTFKNYPIQSGWMIAEKGVGMQEAVLLLKSSTTNLETDFQNLVQSLSSEYGKTSESNQNAANWAFAGREPGLLDLVKNPGENTIRVQLRRNKDGTTPYSWEHVSPGEKQ
jgi:hypothetical protein